MWGLLQVKLKCRNNDDLIKQPTLITETSEFNSAVSAAGDDDRSAEKYFSVARNQKDYLEDQEKKAAAAKKRKRKIHFASGIAAVLAVVCLIGFVAFKYISIESALKYTDGTGGYTVTTGKLFARKFIKEGSVIIPEIYDGKPVTKIADGAFEGNTYLTSVTIPSTVTEIGENAFKGCTNLRKIVFANVNPDASMQANARFAYAGTYTLSVGTPTYTLTNTSNQKITTVQSGVKKIGAKAFYGCTNLASIDASRATEIGEEAFAGCSSLHSIVFGNNLLSLSNGTFSGCSSLKLVDLPSSLTTIGDRCFENCTGFTNFLVPATITTVGDAILTGCVNLTELVVEERSTMGGFSQNWKNGVPDTVKTSIGFRIALDYNHATIPGKDAVSVKQDGGYQLPIPERTGYKFLGWYDSMTNGNRLTDENGQSLSAYAFGRSVTVYALWEAIHTAEALADKAATCTETGYTGRTYCEVCNSVVDWGTILPATGHNYEVVDGVLKCKDCGDLYNGVWTDGKTYVDGVLIADGWNGDYYYVDGKKVTGIYAVDGVYYNFGDDGKSQGKYTGLVRIDGKWCYSKLGSLTGGWVQIEEKWHYFRAYTKTAVTGEYTVNGVTYQFDETGMTNGAWHKDEEGIRYYYGPSYYLARNPGYLALYEIDGKTYNFGNDGYITLGEIQVLRDAASLRKVVYRFADDGSVIERVTTCGFITDSNNDMYYIGENGEISLEKQGLIKVDGAIYYVKPSGKIAVNENRYITPELANGLMEVSSGYVTRYFGTDGKLEQPFTGIKAGEDGILYYYVNDKVCKRNLSMG